MTNFKQLTLFFAAIAIAFTSCKKDEDSTDDMQTQEFIANDATFSGFTSWTLEATNQGPDPSLGAAHGGNDSTVVRSVYFKDGQDPVSGVYPLGTVIVKESKNPSMSVNAITAMVKRGNNFNPSGNNWEWFLLNEDGTIATDPDTGDPMRGANLGQCLNCHSQASNKDYVFTK